MNWVDPEGLFVSENDPTYLYQKVSKTSEHLKFGITGDPATRYTDAEMAGGKLRIIAKGTRREMLALERKLHKTLPLGPQEKQFQYSRLQRQKNIKGCPVSTRLQGIGRVLGPLAYLSIILNSYEAAKIAEETGKSVWEVHLEMMGFESYDEYIRRRYPPL